MINIFSANCVSIYMIIAYDLLTNAKCIKNCM